MHRGGVRHTRAARRAGRAPRAPSFFSRLPHGRATGPLWYHHAAQRSAAAHLPGRPMTVVVTGAAGFIGRSLVPALATRHRKVRAVVEATVHPELVGAERSAGAHVEQLVADVLEPAALAGAFEGAEVVYHLAARVSISGDPGGNVMRTNVIAMK